MRTAIQEGVASANIGDDIIPDAPKGYNGQFVFLRTGSISVDRRYQRGEKFRRAKEMAAEMLDPDTGEPSVDWAGFGVVIVNMRPGAYYAIDGQHRLVALKILGVDFCPCLLFRGKTIAREATSFLNQNDGREPMRSTAWWKAKLAAKDAEVTAAQITLAKWGYRVLDGTSKAHTVTRCTTKILELHRVGGLNNVCCLLYGLWPKNDMAGYASVMSAAHQLLRTHLGDTRARSDAKLYEALGKLSLSDVLMKAKAMKDLLPEMHSVSCGVERQFFDAYNKGMSAPAGEGWDFKGSVYRVTPSKRRKEIPSREQCIIPSDL